MTVAALREYRPAQENKHPSLLTKFRDFIINMRAYFHMKADPVGLPKTLKDKERRKTFKESSQAVEPMQGMMHDWHCRYAPQENHFYVALVATEPDYQGHGYGKMIMSILNSAADECNMACYLEAPEENLKFYESVGYQITKPMTISLSSSILGDFSDSGYLFTRIPTNMREGQES